MQTELLTKEEVIAEMLKGKRATHIYFSDKEWCKLNGHYEIEFEDGCKIDVDTFWKDRSSEKWQIGWSIITEDENPKDKQEHTDIKCSDCGKETIGGICNCEKMNTESKEPLYKVLNEKRMQGKLILDIVEKEGEIHLIPEDGSIVFCSFYCEPLDEQTKADATYTALAINNLSSLAEALEECIKVITPYENLFNAAQERVALIQAKEALKKIS